MKAIIPVAGLGTRLRPHTYSSPKPLLEVAGNTILGHILDELVILGVDEVTFIVNYFGEDIEKWVKKNYSFRSNFVEQKELRGLGHAISLAEPYHRDNEKILIILGDTIFSADLAKVLEWKENALGVKAVEDPRRFGIVELSNDTVTRLVEKPEIPPTNLAIVGIYHISQPFMLFDSLQEIIREGKTTRGEIQLTDALQRMLEKGAPFRTFEIDGWFDCGKFETMLETNRALLDKNVTADCIKSLHKRFPGAVFNGPVIVGEGASISSSVIGPYVSIGSGTMVKDCIIRNSIISSSASISRAVLEDSLVGKEGRYQGSPLNLNIGDLCEVRS
ncbi:MAG TPA: sugar phosphate nucleotidyltransferase [Candidatus Sumerlaeota bacterium]|nr:sugar phosphate nucleotidyltransferase [Candidatus Sumerlaeota bacterium]